MKRLDDAITAAALIAAPLFGWVIVAAACLMVCSSVCGADHETPPTFTVVNKLPPVITVVNKLPKEKPQTTPGLAARPGEPVRVTPGVVIQRPFSEPTPGTIVQDRFGTGQPMSGVVWSLPRLAAGRDAGTSTGRVLGAVRYGRIENCST